MKNIAIIGRLLSNAKWNNLWSILEEAKSEGILDFQGYSIDNGKSVKKEDLDNYDAFIYLGTKPLFEDSRPYIRFTSNAEGSEFVDKITELNEKLFGNDNADEDNISFYNSHNTMDLQSDQEEQVCSEQSNTSEVVLQDSSEEETKEDVKILDIVNEGIKSLTGIVIEINGKDVCLNKDDADKLKELIAFANNQGYKIKDVLVC